MKTNHLVAKWLALLALSTLNPQLSTVFAQGTAFTYQGRLNDGNNPATGLYDLRFSVYDAASGGTPQGSSPQTISTVPVTNGLFTVTLDFGGGVFTGAARWLDISARTNGTASFSALVPRQPLTPAPYAIYAPNAGAAASATVASTTAPNAVNTASLQANSITSDKIVDGTILDADISANGISGNKIVGGDLQAARLEVGASHNLSGQYATIAGGFQNTISNAGWSVDAIGGGSGNAITNAGNATIAGGYQNVIGSGAWAASVAGGANNVVLGGGDSIGGGSGNMIQTNSGNNAIGGGTGNSIGQNSYSATIGGGQSNTVSQASGAVIGGGYNNANDAWCATIPGGYSNVVSGNFALAAGHRAKAYHPGVFVWGDSTEADFFSSGNDQFLIRAAGGVGINTNNPNGAALNVNGTIVAMNFAGSGAGLNSVNAASLNGIITNQLTFNPAGSAPFAVGNASLIANLNADLLDGLRSTAFWQLSGNSGTTPGVNYVGTADNQPLDLRANNSRAMRLQYAYASSPGTSSDTSVNVIGGYAGNAVSTGVVGGTIGGGGDLYWLWKSGYNNYANTVSGNFGTVSGGYNNTAGALGTVSGGYNNTASVSGTVSGGHDNAAGAEGAVPGGAYNEASGLDSFAAGYDAYAVDNNSFVWCDGSVAQYSVGPQSFEVVASGGAGFNLGAEALSITSTKGVALDAEDRPIITRGWDQFASTAGDKAGLGRWGLFMEFDQLVAGIPAEDVGPRTFAVGKYSTDGTYQALITVNQAGNLACNSLTILGGADLAEPFAMSGQDIAPGSVVVIDERNPGRLTLSRGAYDQKVAGVVSGANGIRAGISMIQEQALEAGRNVALSGRVYVLADAQYGSIQPGDLLTTSGTPGHAMKVTDHAKAQGAILGKAMTSLDTGQGMVLVLVTLQ